MPTPWMQVVEVKAGVIADLNAAKAEIEDKTLIYLCTQYTKPCMFSGKGT
jgi:hypothetical protein